MTNKDEWSFEETWKLAMLVSKLTKRAIKTIAENERIREAIPLIFDEEELTN